MLFQLVVLSIERVPCACTEATRIAIGPYSVPVGPVSAIFAAVIVLLAPAVVYGWVRRLLEARAMQAVLGDRNDTLPGSTP